MKLRLYLDTSVLSAYCDERAPERMAYTQEFWLTLGRYEVMVSELVREEIERTLDADRRSTMVGLLSHTREVETADDALALADRYVERGLFSPAMYSDALHLAAAVVERCDILVSWNFKHLVNRRTRVRVHEVNTELGLPMIEILAPSEL